MNQKQPTTPPQPIRGSWEDLLSQARQKAANFNDEAIPLFYKVFDGLCKLPEDRRTQGDGKLQTLLVHSALALQGYLNLRDRYDESLDVLARARDASDANMRGEWEAQIADVLLQAGRTDEGIARLYDLATQPDAEAGDWARLVMALVRVHRPQAALPYLDEAEQRLAARVGDMTAVVEEGEDAPEVGSEASYLADLRAVVALESHDWKAGVAAFEQALERNSAYSQHLHLVYGRLINAGRYEDAVAFLNRDQGRPVRSGFWRGLSLFKQGKVNDAKRVWERVTEIKAEQAEPGSLFEYVLSHYYLGDEAGTAMAGVLGMIRQQQQSVMWSLFLLAGLGWAMRKDMVSARSNIEIAVTQRKSAAEGKLLPYQYWQMVVGLLDEEAQSALSGFFETEYEVEHEIKHEAEGKSL